MVSDMTEESDTVAVTVFIDDQRNVVELSISVCGFILPLRQTARSGFAVEIRWRHGVCRACRF